MPPDATTAVDAGRRAEVYGLLSLLFHSPPANEHVERMAACADRVTAFSELARLARETSADSLRQDFDDLFMVPLGAYVAPYESVYRDAPIDANGRAAPRTFGPSTQAVLAFYERVGLRVARSYGELPDHIGLELACMEYLCVREAEYLEKGQVPAAQKARALACVFLREHLALWTGPLADRIREKARTEYFRTLAAATAAWVKQEAGEAWVRAQT